MLVQTVVIAKSSLGLGDAAVALLLAANGAGSMAAAFALPAVLRRVSERRIMLGGAVLLVLATAAAAGAVTVPAVLGAVAIGLLWFAVGVGWGAVETPVGRLIRRGVPASDLTPAFAAQFSLSHACWLVTYPLAGWLGFIGLPGTAAVLAVLALVATVVAWRLWPAGALSAVGSGTMQA